MLALFLDSLALWVLTKWGGRMGEDDLNRISDDPLDPRRVNRAVYRVEDAWPVLRVVLALRKNWWAILIGVPLGIFIVKPEQAAAWVLSVLAGVGVGL